MSTEFRGSVVQCLDHLRILPTANIPKFIDFTKSNKNTAWGWLLTERVPTGEFWLRSACFFALNDWGVVELDSLDNEARALAELWAYEVLPPKKIREELEYSTPNNDGLLPLVYGKQRFNNQARKLMRQLAEKHADELATRKIELLATYAIDLDDTEQALPIPSHGDPVTQLVGLLKREVLPLVNWLASDEATDAQRAQLVQLMGIEEYLQLAVTLNALKSPTIRRQVLGGRTR
jgi:hypothetical protein